MDIRHWNEIGLMMLSYILNAGFAIMIKVFFSPCSGVSNLVADLPGMTQHRLYSSPKSQYIQWRIQDFSEGGA